MQNECSPRVAEAKRGEDIREAAKGINDMRRVPL